jgi:hypothetical protein
VNPISQILWKAAADVEQRGVTRPPRSSNNQTCAAISMEIAAVRRFSKRWTAAYDEATELIWHSEGTRCVPNWNDAQPSRAVVAAAMRDAAFLASWAGPHLLGGSK